MREFKERSFGGRSRTRSDSHRSREGYGDRESSGFGERKQLEMHDAVCDKCGKPCQLPFRPTQGKPVYCSDCFRNKDSYEGPRSSSSVSPDLLTEINDKLDKIMRALKLN